MSQEIFEINDHHAKADEDRFEDHYHLFCKETGSGIPLRDGIERDIRHCPMCGDKL